jgi:hypothetical protein
MFHATEQESNRALTESSLLYIKSYTLSENKTSSEQDLERFPLLQYTCRYWTNHAKAAKDAAGSHLDNLIFGFLSSDIERSSWLLVHQPDVYYSSPFNNGTYEVAAPLHYASYFGFRTVVKLIIDNGADVNTQAGMFGTALQAASYIGDRDVVKQLLEAGADVNAHAGMFGTVLQAASIVGRRDVVKQLLEAGADVNTQAGMFGTALQAASYRGDRDVVKQLLEAGADVNTRQKVGKYGSALEAALNRNKDDVVRLLLQASADVNELDTEQDLKLQKILKEENGIKNFGLRRETV